MYNIKCIKIGYIPYDLIFKHKFRRKKMVLKPDKNEAEFYNKGIYYCEVCNLNKFILPMK